MRRRIILIVLAAFALAGCGSSSSPSATPASTELSYFPAGSPLVMTIATDPNGAPVQGAEALVARFPFAALGESALKAKLLQAGINYDGEIRPLLGNPLAFGAAGSTLSGSAANDFLVVWVTKDAGTLATLVKKLPGVHAAGTHDNANLYQTGGGATTLAIDGATAVLGPSPAGVASALDRHAHSSGIISADYSRAFSGLPRHALIQMFGNLTSVLSTPSAAKARRVPWVAAFRGYAAAVSASASGLTFHYRLDTTGAPLTSAQLPFATGSSAPGLAGTLPITVGIHDPAQIAAFVEAAEQATSPVSYGTFLKRQAAVRAKTRVDLNSLVRLLSGDLIIASDTHTTLGRAAVSDRAAATSVLSKLVRAPRSVFNKATRVTKLGGGFYAIKEPSQTITVGVVSNRSANQLVAGNATPARLRAFAAAPASPAPGAQGTVAFRIGLVQLLHLALKQAPPQIVQTILSSLGDITGWIAAGPSGVTGSATLAVR